MPPAAPSITTNPANTSSITWPAIMLANNRTDSEMIRDRYEMTSITTISGNSTTGTPFGTK